MSWEESEEFKKAKEAYEKRASRPQVQTRLERVINADDADEVAAAIKRGDFDIDTGDELGLNMSKVERPKSDDGGGGDGDGGDGGEEDGEERGPKRRGYYGS